MVVNKTPRTPCVACRSGGVLPTLATSEKRLISTLLENYKRNGVDGRPVLDTSRPLAVAIGFTPVQTLSYDDDQQIISLVGWLNLVRTYRQGRHQI